MLDREALRKEWDEVVAEFIARHPRSKTAKALRSGTIRFERLIADVEDEFRKRPRLECVHLVAWSPLYGSIGRGEAVWALYVTRNGQVGYRTISGRYGAVWGLPMYLQGR